LINLVQKELGQNFSVKRFKLEEQLGSEGFSCCAAWKRGINRDD
jgi:hypothetical protein